MRGVSRYVMLWGDWTLSMKCSDIQRILEDSWCSDHAVPSLLCPHSHINTGVISNNG